MEAFPAAVAIADEVGAIFALEVLVADAFSGDASAFSGAAIEAGREGAIIAGEVGMAVALPIVAYSVLRAVVHALFDATVTAQVIIQTFTSEGREIAGAMAAA